MTIAEQSPLNRHLGDGLNDTFVYTFSILADGDLVVFLDDTRLTQGNQYNLQNQTDVGGEVLFTNSPALDAEIVIKRETSRDQEVVYTPFDPFPAKSHEGALDKLTMLVQEAFGRAQFGLPLDGSGNFWDGEGLRIDNVLSPISDDQVATKRYVDIQTDDPPPGSWDPDSDWDTTGNWFNNGNWDFLGDLLYKGDQVAIEDDIPNISGLAEKSVELISTDTEVLTIGTPTLADDVDFTIRTQVANGLAKLNVAGKIPSEILDASGLEFLGVRDPADGLPVDATAGQFYVFVESGNISLLDSDGNAQLTDVVPGDTMLWSDSPVSGFYFVARVIDTLTADLVSYDPGLVPADRQLAAIDVQAALDALASEYARVTADEEVAGGWNFIGAVPQHLAVDLATVAQIPDVSDLTSRLANETITGQWAFGAGITLVGSAWPSEIGGPGQIIVSDGLGQLNWENQTGGGGGLDPSEDAFITGDWEWLAPLRLANAIGIQARETGGTLREILVVNAFDAVGVGVTALPLTIRSSAAPSWNDGFDTRQFVFAELDELVSGEWTFSADVEHSANIILQNNDQLLGRDTGATPRGLARINSADVAIYGNPVTDTQIIGPEIDLITQDLRLDGAPLNDDSGLIQLTEAGKVPASLLPFTSLEFQGVFDASSGSNPADGVDGGEFYVINVAGTLTIFTEDNGVPVATAVEPGDYLLWLNSPTVQVSGWYYVTREAPTFIDSDNVTYDNSNERWLEGTVQDVLDEISERVGIRDENEVIGAQWTFDAGLRANSAITIANNANLSFDATPGGTLRALRLNASDQLEIGQNSSVMEGIIYNSGNATSSHTFDVGVTKILDIIPTGLRMAINQPYRGFDGGGVERFMLRFVGDVCAVGSSNNTTRYDGINHTFANLVTFNSSARLGNNIPLTGRIASLAQEFNLAKVGTSDVVEYGNDSLRTVVRSFEQEQHVVGGVTAAFFLSPDSGALTIANRASSTRIAGFRGGGSFDLVGNLTLAQRHEDTTIHLVGTTLQDLGVEQLFLGSTIRVITEFSVIGCRLIAGAGVTIRTHQGGAQFGGNVLVAPSSVCEIVWRTTTEVRVFGNGLSPA